MCPEIAILRALAKMYGKHITIDTYRRSTFRPKPVCNIQPGSIIGIADPHRTGNTWGGRVIGSSYYDISNSLTSTIQLDRTFTWDNTLNYWITYQNPMGDGVITRQITSYATAAGLSIIKVDDGASLYDLPITDSMYVITSSTNDYRTFRVIANKEQKGFQYEITAVQHEPKKFDDIDQYQPLVPPGGTPYSSWPVASPRNLSLSVRTYTVAMVVQSDITLSWSPPASPNPADPPDTNDPRVIKYDISWSNPNVANSQWQWLTTTQSTSFTVVNVLAGNYKFAVRAVTPLANGPYAYVATSPTSPIRPAVLQFSQTK